MYGRVAHQAPRNHPDIKSSNALPLGRLVSKLRVHTGTNLEQRDGA